MQCLQEMLKTFESRWNDLSILYAKPWSEPWVLRSGLRDDFEIYVIEKGHGAITVGERSYSIKEGNAFVLYSMDGKSFTPDDSCAFRMSPITFCIKDSPNESSAKQELIQKFHSSSVILELRDPKRVQNFMCRMNRKILLQKPGYRIS